MDEDRPTTPTTPGQTALVFTTSGPASSAPTSPPTATPAPVSPAQQSVPTCDVCRTSYGRLIYCGTRGAGSARSNCPRQFHVLCAWYAGHYVHVSPGTEEGLGYLYAGGGAGAKFSCCCPDHVPPTADPELRDRDKQRSIRLQYRVRIPLECLPAKERARRRRDEEDRLQRETGLMERCAGLCRTLVLQLQHTRQTLETVIKRETTKRALVQAQWDVFRCTLDALFESATDSAFPTGLQEQAAADAGVEAQVAAHSSTQAEPTMESLGTPARRVGLQQHRRLIARIPMATLTGFDPWDLKCCGGPGFSHLWVTHQHPALNSAPVSAAPLPPQNPAFRITDPRQTTPSTALTGLDGVLTQLWESEREKQRQTFAHAQAVRRQVAALDVCHAQRARVQAVRAACRIVCEREQQAATELEGSYSRHAARKLQRVKASLSRRRTVLKSAKLSTWGAAATAVEPGSDRFGDRAAVQPSAIVQVTSPHGAVEAEATGPMPRCSAFDNELVSQGLVDEEGAEDARHVSTPTTLLDHAIAVLEHALANYDPAVQLKDPVTPSLAVHPHPTTLVQEPAVGDDVATAGTADGVGTAATAEPTVELAANLPYSAGAAEAALQEVCAVLSKYPQLAAWADHPGGEAPSRSKPATPSAESSDAAEAAAAEHAAALEALHTASVALVHSLPISRADRLIPALPDERSNFWDLARARSVQDALDELCVQQTSTRDQLPRRSTSARNGLGTAPAPVVRGTYVQTERKTMRVARLLHDLRQRAKGRSDTRAALRGLYCNQQAFGQPLCFQTLVAEAMDAVGGALLPKHLAQPLSQPQPQATNQTVTEAGEPSQADHEYLSWYEEVQAERLNAYGLRVVGSANVRLDVVASDAGSCFTRMTLRNDPQRIDLDAQLYHILAAVRDCEVSRTEPAMSADSAVPNGDSTPSGRSPSNSMDLDDPGLSTPTGVSAPIAKGGNAAANGTVKPKRGGRRPKSRGRWRKPATTNKQRLNAFTLIQVNDPLEDTPPTGTSGVTLLSSTALKKCKRQSKGRQEMQVTLTDLEIRFARQQFESVDDVVQYLRCIFERIRALEDLSEGQEIWRAVSAMEEAMGHAVLDLNRWYNQTARLPGGRLTTPDEASGTADDAVPAARTTGGSGARTSVAPVFLDEADIAEDFLPVLGTPPSPLLTCAGCATTHSITDRHQAQHAMPAPLHVVLKAQNYFKAASAAKVLRPSFASHSVPSGQSTNQRAGGSRSSTGSASNGAGAGTPAGDESVRRSGRRQQVSAKLQASQQCIQDTSNDWVKLLSGPSAAASDWFCAECVAQGHSMLGTCYTKQTPTQMTV